MESDIEGELSRLSYELQIVREALNRRTRRGSRSPSRNSGTKKPAGVPRAEVLAVAKSLGPRMRPTDVRAAFNARGVEVTGEAIRQSMRRLRDEGQLRQLDDGEYELASANGSGTEPHSEAPRNGAETRASTAGK
jgi:hypothetical protein